MRHYDSRRTFLRINILTLFVLTLLLIPYVPMQGFSPGKHQTATGQALERLPPDAGVADWEREKMLAGSFDADIVEGGWPGTGAPYDPRFHFDNHADYESVRENFVAVARLIRDNVLKPEKDPWEFGKILHAVEDFYSHSNYVLLYRLYRTQRNEMVGSIPPLEAVLLHPDQYPGFEDVLRESLRTGIYPNHDFPPDDTDHGYIVGPGLHKDTWQRTYHTEAMETAETAVAWYLKLYRREGEAMKEFSAVWGVEF